MWTATVSYKSISTGKSVKPEQVYTANSRIEVENLFMGQTTELYKQGIYLTAWLESPIGTFFVDPTGWSIIHSRELKGYMD